MQEKHNLKFRNKLGFVLASVGSAVGMGNIWLFPYRVGQYGGAAFLLVYFFFVALFGYAGLSAEFAFGRLTGTGPIGSYQYALQTRGKKGGGVLGANGVQIFPSDFGVGMLTLPVGGFLVLAALIAAMQWALARPKKDKEESK